jgi:hypothetical protein
MSGENTMARQFSIPTVLRMIPNRLLERLFRQQGYIQFHWNWKGLRERDVEKLQNAINVQPQDSQLRIENELRDLFDLACDKGMEAIAEAAYMAGAPDFAANMPAEGLYYRSAWTRLEHPAYFEEALRIMRTNNITWWRKRKDLPKQRIDVNQILLARLGTALSEYLVRAQGRGGVCTVEACEDAAGTLFFYAYPDDFARQTTAHDAQQELQPVEMRTTFSVVFAYNRQEGSLEVSAQMIPKIKTCLEKIFAQEVFGITLPPWEPDAVYDLDLLKDRSFKLDTSPQDKIRVQVRSLRLVGPENGRRNTIEVTDKDDDIHAAIDEWINKRNISLAEVHVSQATLRFEFLEKPGRKPGIETVEISYPNCCALNNRRPERVAIIRDSLKRWQLDVSRTMVLDFEPLEPDPGYHRGGPLSQAS